jgi:hypothetical protein
MNVYRHGNVLDVCTFRPRFVLTRRSSRLDVQDACHADPYCPDFIASWRSQLGWLAMHPTRIAQNAAGIIRLAAEIARCLRCLEQQPVHTRDVAQSQAVEHRPDRRLRADNVRLVQLTAANERMTCAPHQLHAVEPRNRDNNSEPPARPASGAERKDPDRSNSRSPPVQPQVCIRRSSIGCNELRTSPIGLGVGS